MKIMRKALLSAEVEIEIPFQDVDAMQVAWHGNYFRYFEAARSQLLRQIDYDYPEMRASEYMWPIIEAHVRFVCAVRYRQRVIVAAALVEWENRLKIDYLVRDADSGTRLTTGYTIQCAVDARTQELQLVSPPVLLERLKAYL
ncbi:MAG: acyl-CoA thioesterase [Gammaproteobacteria bacterium]